MSIPPIGLENPDIVEWRTRKSGFFDHHALEAGMACDDCTGEHPAHASRRAPRGLVPREPNVHELLRCT